MRHPNTRTTAAMMLGRAGTDADLRCIRDGLETTSAPQDVAIIGAGVAGMCAALLLADAGHKVTLYEASQRVGGRIYTVREPFSTGLYAEAGAMRLPSFYPLSLEYIKKFRLPTNPFLNEDAAGQAFIYVNGVKLRRAEYHQGSGLGYPLLPEEASQPADALLAAALKPIADYVGKDPLEGYVHNRWKDVVERFGESSVRAYLKAQTFLSEGAIEMIEVLLDLESRSDQALLQQIVEINDHSAGVNYVEITGGMDQFSKAFAQNLAERDVPIQFGRRLVALDAGSPDGRVQMRFDPASPAAAPTVATADRVIVTIPFPALRYVKATPLFSHGKRKAIRELHYDASTKIMLEFSRRFWELDDGIYGGCTVTDLPSRFIYYPSHGWGDPSGVIISSYTWGDEARGWDSFSHDDQIRLALDDVAAIHGEDIRQYFVRGVVQSWATDHYSHGEAAMFYGGQLSELQASIPTAEGRVHFAGEHTSLKHAWIEGALESAIRAANEVNTAPHPAP